MAKDVLANNKGNLKKVGVFVEGSGVTNNAPESLNAVLKRMVDNKESSIDGMMLVLFFLQNFYLREILRGRAALGGYKLKPRTSRWRLKREEIHFQVDVVTPTEITNKINYKLQ